MQTWAKNHKALSIAAIIIPIFGLYARKTIGSFITAQRRHPQPDQRPAQDVDYFGNLADAFSKATSLVGKIFKVVKLFVSEESKWLDNAASL
jgi:hypothetical protein